jgi:archaemetzincin
MRNLLFVLMVLFISSCEKQETSVVVKPKVVKSVKTPKTIFVVPMGKTSNFDVNYIVNELKQFYKCDVKVLPKVETPAIAKVNGLKRYRAIDILNFLSTKYKKNNGKVLALTDGDICTDRELNGIVYKNWGVFGLGRLNDKPCVISTNRFKTNYYDRLSKVTIHEIGHTLGLSHCDNDKNCLMSDAKGKGGQVDSEKKWMCDKCRKKIKL